MAISIVGGDGNRVGFNAELGTTGTWPQTVVSTDVPPGYDFSVAEAGDCFLMLYQLTTAQYISGTSSVTSANVTWTRVATIPPLGGSNLIVTYEVWFGKVTGSVSGITFAFTAPADGGTALRQVYAVQISGYLFRSDSPVPVWKLDGSVTAREITVTDYTLIPLSAPVTAHAGEAVLWFIGGELDNPVANDGYIFDWWGNLTTSTTASSDPNYYYALGIIYVLSAPGGRLSPSYSDDNGVVPPFPLYCIPITFTDGSILLGPENSEISRGYAADGYGSPRTFTAGAEPSSTAKSADRGGFAR